MAYVPSVFSMQAYMHWMGNFGILCMCGKMVLQRIRKSEVSKLVTLYLKYSGTKIFHPLLAQVHIICDTLSPREYTLQIYCEHFCIFCKT